MSGRGRGWKARKAENGWLFVGRREQVYAEQGTVLRATSQSETKSRKVRGQMRQRAEASSLASGLSAKDDG